jgi:hypothetical protein
MADRKLFNPERAKATTLEAVKMTGWTLAANADNLLPLIVEQLGAPSTEHAKRAVSMAYKILLMLELSIEEASPSEVHDAHDKIEAMRKRAHH